MVCVTMYVLVDFSVSSLDIYRCACVREASSASKIQEVSEAVCQDAGGQAPSSTQHLRQIGASGKHPGNCERDLHRYRRARHLSCGIEPYEVQTVLNNEYGQIAEGCLPVLLPHKIMWALWQQDEAEFFSRVSAKCDAETFWANSVACGHVEGHPHKDQIECDPSACIPLRVHGDEAPISRAEGLMVLQCTSVLFPPFIDAVQLFDVGCAHVTHCSSANTRTTLCNHGVEFPDIGHRHHALSRG